MEKLGWQLSVQLYTYRRYPLFEALDKVAELGIRHIEPLTALKVDAKRPELRANEDLPPDVRKELKTMLADRGMFLSLRKMKGRIISIHLKDIAKKNEPSSRNTVFGEGEGDFANSLKELKRLGYRGLTTIDFEHDITALQEDMARNVAFVEDQVKRLLAETK
jgi:sugar phosphate isomerase/epimerase